jgi:predicted acyltransferase
MIAKKADGTAGAADVNTSPFTYERLYSLDALRGFDMFWIMGGEEIFHTLAKTTGSPFWEAIANQFTHPDWNGFHLYDLIFPLFLFMAGVSTPYSVGRELEKVQKQAAINLRVIKRAAILVLLGLVVNNGLKLCRIYRQDPLCQVLGRIGIAYMFANIIYLYSQAQMANGMVLVFHHRVLAVIEVYIGTGFSTWRPYHAG